VFLSEQCAVSKVTTSVRSSVFQPWHRPTIVLLLVYCHFDNTFSKSAKKVTVRVSSCYYCYGNNAAGSKPI